MTYREIVKMLSEIADLLSIMGDNDYRIRAYRRAVAVIISLEDDAIVRAKNGTLRKMYGIGASIDSKITEFVKTGRLAYLEELKAKLPEPGTIELLTVPSIGPVKVRSLNEVGIFTLAALKEALDIGTLAGVSGFSDKVIVRIREALAKTSVGGRRPRADVLPVAKAYLRKLRGLKQTTRATIAGSIRRKRDTIKDIDILVVSSEPAPVMEAVKAFKRTASVISSGNTSTAVYTQCGLRVDIRVVKAESYACALQYFTGSKEFNVRLRRRALEIGYSLSEYGLRPLDGSKPPKISSERKLFEILGIGYIKPEERI